MHVRAEVSYFVHLWTLHIQNHYLLLDLWSASWAWNYMFCFSITILSTCRCWTRMESVSPLFYYLLLISLILSLISPRLVTVMIPGPRGTLTPPGAPVTTGHPIQRAPRQGQVVETPGPPCPMATRRPTRVQVGNPEIISVVYRKLVLLLSCQKSSVGLFGFSW